MGGSYNTDGSFLCTQAISRHSNAAQKCKIIENLACLSRAFLYCMSTTVPFSHTSRRDKGTPAWVISAAIMRGFCVNRQAGKIPTSTLSFVLLSQAATPLQLLSSPALPFHLFPSCLFYLFSMSFSLILQGLSGLEWSSFLSLEILTVPIILLLSVRH